ncbi:unnamed protein product [Paramecium octaurelia]|uniref:Uncharacterized protein n=1 Tax=Paramecium octaurelia TaxID=43137 RepID=A0A8S1WJV4_PAROT|nr:unnamed protein product [Paramecium octaurelia]
MVMVRQRHIQSQDRVVQLILHHLIILVGDHKKQVAVNQELTELVAVLFDEVNYGSLDLERMEVEKRIMMAIIKILKINSIGFTVCFDQVNDQFQINECILDIKIGFSLFHTLLCPQLLFYEKNSIFLFHVVLKHFHQFISISNLLLKNRFALKTQENQ